MCPSLKRSRNTKHDAMPNARSQLGDPAAKIIEVGDDGERVGTQGLDS